MRGIKLVSAVVIALALTAVVSATAFAANPEFLPGTAGAKFTGKSGKATLAIKGGSTITCKESVVEKGNGELLGPKTGLAIIDFKGCTAFGLPANTLGDAKEIILVHVETELCTISLVPLVVGIIFTPLPVHIEIPSVGLLVSVTGSFVGSLTPLNTLTTTYTLTIAQSGGVQAIEKCEGGAARTLLSSVDGGANTQSGEEAEKGTLTFEVAEELMG
jgi:hypothetical protein